MASIKDVAEKAGVSVATVSRVMNQKGPLSKKTINAVHAAMEELKYEPNDFARALSGKKRANIIALYALTFKHPFYAALLAEIETAVINQGYRLLILSSFEDEEKEEMCRQLIRRNVLDGILIGGHPKITERDPLLEEKIPMVTVEALLEGLPYVVSDNYEGGRLATKRLLEAGCKHLVHIAGNRQHEADQRAQAFEDLCGEAGIDFHIYTTSLDMLKDRDYHEIVARVFDENPKIDGIFASSDIIAAEVIRYAGKKGISVPKDLKVIGFDNSDIGSYLNPGLTTVAQDIELLAKTAVDKLVRIINGEEVKNSDVIPVSLVERDSVSLTSS